MSQSFGQTTLTWCGHENGTTVDTSCFRQPLKGNKGGADVDVVSFKVSFHSQGTDYTFESKTNRLSADIIEKILALPEAEIKLYFNDIRGMASTGLSYHTFNGSFTLTKPVAEKKDGKTSRKNK